MISLKETAGQTFENGVTVFSLFITWQSLFHRKIARGKNLRHSLYDTVRHGLQSGDVRLMTTVLHFGFNLHCRPRIFVKLASFFI